MNGRMHKRRFYCKERPGAAPYGAFSCIWLRTEPTRRYVYSANHKGVGTMYVVVAVVARLVGGALSYADGTAATGLPWLQRISFSLPEAPGLSVVRRAGT